jgi:Do/DeqQ family serine protease
MRKIIGIFLLAFTGGIAGAWLWANYYLLPRLSASSANQYTAASYHSPMVVDNPPAAPLQKDEALPTDDTDFSLAAARAIPSVVYINSIFQGASYSPFDWFFGGTPTPQTKVSSGSGVIFTSDGYIVTNNHVVEAAEKIEINYNKKIYQAELVGTDPSTDLAVLKINETNLPAIQFGSSRNVRVGEWVIAVGNPFSLSSTVTAGIVSAKGRRIGILEDRFPIESFIQTDAAINPGNSGGALVNKAGELVGINTAILSRTGSYTGYAFAIPVDIARKVVDDIVKFGMVQRAFWGGSVIDYNYENARKYDLPTNVPTFNGVLVERITRDGPADQAGLKPGDVITHINQTEVNSRSAFEEELSYRYPGDKVTFTYLRNGKSANTVLTLVNKAGNTEILRRKIFSSATIGAQLEATDYGVRVFKITGGYFKQLGMPENYTIISINRVRVKDPQEVIDFFEKYKGRVYLYGMTSSREILPYNFILR